MEKLKVGIIGAGRIGQVHAKSITYHIPQAEIVAISDIYVDGAKKVAQELGIPNYYEDYHEILNNPEINAVLICSSTDTHADIAVEAAAEKYEPYLVARSVMAVCTACNKFYYEVRIMAEDEADRTARLALADAARITIATGLSLLGIKAPERM